MSGGGLVDVFIMDDCTFLLDPGMVDSVLDAYGDACARPDVGGTRNITKAIITLYATDKHMADNAWDLQAIRRRATLRTPLDVGKKLGVTLGGQAHRLKTL